MGKKESPRTKGISPAIGRQCELFRRSTGIRCVATVVPKCAVADRDRSAAISRILQEALSNVARHSGASRVHVRLEEEDGVAVLTVEDDGRGIATADARKPGVHGLVGMRERVRPWGGDVTVCGAPGAGTTVTVLIPKKRKGGAVDPGMHR